MDFFDLSKPFSRVHLSGGKTNGYVKVSHDNRAKKFENKPEKNEYVNEYLLKEKEGLINLYTLEQKRENVLKTDDVTNKNTNEANKCTAELTSIGTFPDINNVDDEKSSLIYEQYYTQNNKPSSKMDINKVKSKILSVIELNEVTIITGPTGCGKSTQVPQYILDSYAEKNQYCNIIVTQPRRIAAITVPKRVCLERNWTLGTICGYKVGLKNCTSEDTRLTYATVGVFLQILLHKKNMNDYTHVILDEVHERDQTMDFTLLVVKKFLRYNSRNVKVILMSATADATKFAKYFESPVLGKLIPAPIFSIAKPTNYLLQIHYLEELSPLGELPVINFDDPWISDLHIMVGIKLIKQFEKLDSNTINKKSVLVFLPGIYEIEEFYNKLKNPKIYKSGEIEYKWFPIPLHSSITIEEQDEAFHLPPSGYRKIILATNIAESSITVPDVMFVIDYCLTKVLVTDPETNFTCLKLGWASKTNLIQRGGRAGRVMDGRVYRMIYKDDYDKLDEFSAPAMLRCPLEKVVLQAKLLDMGHPKAVLALAVDPPDLRNIQNTILILKEAGGLLLNNQGHPSSSDGDLTFLGKLMISLPVDIHITKLIALGYVYNCLDDCIIMGAAMSLKNVFSNPFQARLKTYNSKLDWADGSCSDCIAFLNVFEPNILPTLTTVGVISEGTRIKSDDKFIDDSRRRLKTVILCIVNIWKTNHSRGYFKRSQGGGEAAWAKRHFIQLRALKEVSVLVEEIKQRLKTYGIESLVGEQKIIWDEMDKTLVRKFVIAGAFYPNYFTRGARGGQVDEKEAVKTLSGRDPFTTVYFQNYPLNQPPGLYSHLIKEALSECKEDMKISYDHSKVFIEFCDHEIVKSITDVPFNGRVPGRISMAVYRAVKMREVMKYLEIKVLPSDVAKKKAELLKNKDCKETNNRSGQVMGKAPMLRSLLPGMDISYIFLKITYIESPGSFWAVQEDSITQKVGKDITKMLNFGQPDLIPYSRLPQIGEMCAAPYKEDENDVCFYRAKVTKIFNVSDKAMASVFFIDFGNSELVPVNNLRMYGTKLFEVITGIPAQAFKCTLTKIKPSPMKNQGEHWSETTNRKFEEIVAHGKLIGSIYSIVSGVVSLVLYKIIETNNSKQQININELLINEGFAEITEESYLSKMNNQLRKERRSEISLENDCNPIQTKEIWMSPPPIDYPTSECGQIPVKLRGPFSPLEMTIFSSTQGGALKQIKIAPGSVNSVLLDSDPQDPGERLIVAGHVGQSQSGGVLLLHNTTLMPNIYGLSALIPFVFSPVLEFRINEKRTMYTGILCGLGADKFGQSLFPEHDMEVVFDCEFTTEDFVIVNKLRFLMGNLLLGHGYSETLQGRPDLVSFQQNIKECFKKLIYKPRLPKELEFPANEYRWKVVEPDVVVVSPEIQRNSEISIYPIHLGVSIKSHALEKKRLNSHIRYLHSLAQLSKPVPKIHCQICDLTLINQKFLRLHLASDSHVEKETKIINMPDYS